MFLRGLWGVYLNGDLFEASQRHLMPAGYLKSPVAQILFAGMKTQCFFHLKVF